MIKYFTLCFFLTTSFSFAQSWSKLNDLPNSILGRDHPFTFALNGHGFMGAGSTIDGLKSDFYKYDPLTDQWTELDSFPGGPRGYSYGFNYKGYGYAGFGISTTAYLKDLWRFDPSTETWSELASCPCEGRGHPAFLAADDKIFVGLGSSRLGNLKDWWEYDIKTNQWQQRDSFPGVKRHHPYYFEVNEKAYVGFGHGEGIFKDLYEFDPKSNTWAQMSDLPAQGRVAGTQFSYQNKGYILSGQGEDHDYLGEGEFWEFNPLTNDWKQLTSHPGQGRWAPGSFVIGNKVYFVTGELKTYMNDVMSYELSPIVNTKDVTSNTDIPFEISPNPAHQLLNIEAKVGYDLVGTFDIENNLGQTVISTNSKELNHINFDLTSFSTGTYYLHFKNQIERFTMRFLVVK